MKKMRALISVLLVSMLLLASCASSEEEPSVVYTKYSASFFDTFDTLILFTAYAPDEETFDAVYAQVHERFVALNKIYDGYNAYDGVVNLYELNRSGAQSPVAVDPLLYDLIKFCKEKQPLLHGRVNIAMGSVLSIWHDYREAGLDAPQSAQLPPMEDLKSAAQHVNFDNVILDDSAHTVFFSDPLLTLDLGAVAKGYATEIVAKELLNSSLSSFIISAGGNVRAGHAPMDGRIAWGIGVQNPQGSILSTDSQDLSDVLYLADCSVVTSGDYQRYYTVDGVRYHHLIDPDTLMPGDIFPSVTIVTEDSGLADLLSTAVFLMPFDEGLSFVESFEGVEALWVFKDGTIAMTDGLKPYAKSQGAVSR